MKFKSILSLSMCCVMVFGTGQLFTLSSSAMDLNNCQASISQKESESPQDSNLVSSKSNSSIKNKIVQFFSAISSLLERNSNEDSFSGITVSDDDVTYSIDTRDTQELRIKDLLADASSKKITDDKSEIYSADQKIVETSTKQ